MDTKDFLHKADLCGIFKSKDQGLSSKPRCITKTAKNLPYFHNFTLPTKVCIIQAMVFPGVLYRCKSWTIKKAECQRINAFELWCWRRPLRVPWTARRSNQSSLKEINPEYSLEGLMLQLQFFGHLMWKANSLALMLGKIEGKRRRGQQRMRRLNGILDPTDMSSSKLLEVCEGQGSLVCCSPWSHKELDMT